MELNGWKLPRSTRRRTGRAHTGRIQRDVSNERWCSDGLEIACWNCELVQFVIDQLKFPTCLESAQFYSGVDRSGCSLAY